MLNNMVTTFIQLVITTQTSVATVALVAVEIQIDVWREKKNKFEFLNFETVSENGAQRALE